MKEEIMKVLSLLESGVISAEEADKLIKTINVEEKGKKTDWEDKFAKVGAGIGKFAKTVGEKADKLAKDAEPYVKKVGEKAGDAAEEIIGKAKNINLSKKEAKKNSDDVVDVEHEDVTEKGCCGEAEENDFVKDVKIVTMPESQSFSSKDEVENGKEE